MKKLFLLIGLLGLSLLSQAQQVPNENPDLIILDNGSKFIGEVIEYDIESHILIQTSMPNPIRLPISSVKKVIQDYLVLESLNEGLQYDRTYVQLEAGSPMTPDATFGIEASVSAIKQFNQRVGIGGGVSYVKYTFHEYSDERTERIPVYVSFRSYLIDNKAVSPFFQLNAGYAFNIHDDVYKAGRFINPKLGLRFGNSGLMYNFYAGLHLTKSDTDRIETTWGSTLEQIRTIRRMTIGVGIMF